MFNQKIDQQTSYNLWQWYDQDGQHCEGQGKEDHLELPEYVMSDNDTHTNRNNNLFFLWQIYNLHQKGNQSDGEDTPLLKILTRGW